MGTLLTRVHVVKKGESISAIAQQYGISDWKKLYNAASNQRLRILRPNPNIIQPGDKIFIPADSKVVGSLLRTRLEKLYKIREDTINLLKQIQDDLKKEHKNAKQFNKNIDIIATILGIVVGQVGNAKSAYKTLSLSGDELAKANATLIRDHFLSPTGNTATIVAIVGSCFDEAEETDGMIVAFGKILIKSWSDLWSPSYWTGWLTGINLDQAFKESIDHIAISQQKLLASIDQRIEQNRILLAQVEKEKF
ncbi:MAG: LysM peptidoglycan-binding domain-containing protein [Desulfamplus sp.]|nr:LysM peptidoglycan-binding domain-containing protein [Desulfamplus sp.]